MVLHLSKLTISDFEKLLNLYIHQPWLRHRQEAIIELLKLCEQFSEQKLMYDLLHEFTYITQELFNTFLERTAEQITNCWNMDESTTRIVCFSHDYEPDSSHGIIYSLRSILSECGWYSGKINIFFTNCHHALKNLNSYKKINIIFVDEFIGSGQTINNRLKEFRSHLKNINNIIDFRFKVCVQACMNQALKIIKNYNAELFCPYLLNRGISDNFKGANLKNAKEIMLRLESLLEDRINDKELPSFGYGQAEALYVRRDLGNRISNTPNSVFPIFWWPKLKGNIIRNTILKRAKI